jgi:two-component sensor histidine kinase
VFLDGIRFDCGGADWTHWRTRTLLRFQNPPITLSKAIVLPYEDTESTQHRILVIGPDIPISAALTTDFALLLHEFATNAAKYGALSTARGKVDIFCTDINGFFSLAWMERGGPRIDRQPDSEGFGSQLARATVVGRLGGEQLARLES